MNIKKLLALILIVTGLDKLNAQRIGIVNVNSCSIYFGALVDRDSVNSYSNYMDFTLKPGEKRYFISSKIHEIAAREPNPDPYSAPRPILFINHDSDACFTFNFDKFEKISQQDYDQF